MNTPPRDNFPLEEMDKRSWLHPLTSVAEHLRSGPTIVSRAHGVTVASPDGVERIDCSAGLWCVNAGYARTELADAAAEAIRTLSYFHLFGSSSNEPAIRLADRVLMLLHDHAGARHLSKVLFGTSGLDANDTNFKLVRYYNNLRGKKAKKKFIARIGGYHGLTYAAASLTGIPSYHTAFDLPLDGVLYAACPNFYRFGLPGEDEAAFTRRLLDDLKTLIHREGPDTIGAFVAEPVMGTGGVILPTKGYFEQVQEVLQDNDILFVVDEVITGFGRTGSWFATGLYDLRPDIVTLAKGITSAYFPVSASVISETIWDVLCEASPEVGPVMHGFTYSGHPVGGAIGLANLDIIEREGLVENAARLGSHFLQLLQGRTSDHPYVGAVRGVGLMLGVEFVADKRRRRFFRPGANPHRLVAKRAFEHGVIVRALPFGEVTSFSPPLCITEKEVKEAVERYTKALEASTGELRTMAEQ
jgi:L-2,4-diaminobutyrate transaminase